MIYKLVGVIESQFSELQVTSVRTLELGDWVTNKNN